MKVEIKFVCLGDPAKLDHGWCDVGANNLTTTLIERSWRVMSISANLMTCLHCVLTYGSTGYHSFVSLLSIPRTQSQAYILLYKRLSRPIILVLPLSLIICRFFCFRATSLTQFIENTCNICNSK